MELLVFTCLNPRGKYQECVYGGLSLESCFDVLNTLVSQNWKLITIKLSSYGGCEILLPIEAFDGQLFTPSLELLQHEWEEILQLR